MPRRMPDESIYQLIPRPEETSFKPPMYRSHYNAKVPPSCSTFGLQNTTKLTGNESGMEPIGWESQQRGQCHVPKRPAATFGRELLPSIDPQQFLKKSSREMLAQTAPAAMETYQRPLVAPRRPPVVTRSEKPVMGLTSQKNFVVANAVDAVTLIPKRRSEPGPRAIERTTFGTVPKYLDKIKAMREAEQSYIEEMHQQQNGPNPQAQMRALTEDEKANMIAGLKRRWEEIHKQYQALTFNIDTVTKVQRKEGLEVEMEQIEKAVQKLSRKNVLVYDDQAMGYY
eukprot:TRINITY_DN234_c0_g1_i1.p1 TRINITY_DN234_c0_g1~~TRINITY_DN234_c0_g1_i1.p1  ORF type:complete len:284 (-),score=48.26 TRINITY_DN234_c0_g1_i1:32-883(-)